MKLFESEVSRIITNTGKQLHIINLKKNYKYLSPLDLLLMAFEAVRVQAGGGGWSVYAHCYSLGFFTKTRDLIEVGVNVTVSREKRNFNRSPSQYAQRAGSARKLLQCVLIRATWLHLGFGIIINAKVPFGQKSSILPRRYGLLPAFSALWPKINFSFHSKQTTMK